MFGSNMLHRHQSLIHSDPQTESFHLEYTVKLLSPQCIYEKCWNICLFTSEQLTSLWENSVVGLITVFVVFMTVSGAAKSVKWLISLAILIWTMVTLLKFLWLNMKLCQICFNDDKNAFRIPLSACAKHVLCRYLYISGASLDRVPRGP